MKEREGSHEEKRKEEGRTFISSLTSLPKFAQSRKTRISLEYPTTIRRMSVAVGPSSLFCC